MDPTTLARQSDKFHAFEWLRGLALAGHRHAQVILDADGVLEAVRQQAQADIFFGPVPELKGTVPVVLYRPDQAAADEMIADLAVIRPQLKPRKLP